MINSLAPSDTSVPGSQKELSMIIIYEFGLLELSRKENGINKLHDSTRVEHSVFLCS